ncbi:MAG: hypothetical protein AAGF26_11185 [Cyanobacteria bacterium P01_G01_bin.49]
MINTPEFLHQFDDEITTSQQIPFCQVHNPENLPLSKIKQFNLPWGIFIPVEQAELAELNIPDYFTPMRLL